MAAPITPTRNQIAKMAQDDPELTKALEQLFTVAIAAPVPADIAALTILIGNNAYDAGVANNKAESYQPNFQKLDYVDFNRIGPHVPAARRMQWNDDDGTIDVGLNADVVLQVGQEMQFYAKNTSGGAIDNGSTVMFTGALGASGKLTFSKAVADGSIISLYMMGVATEDIPDNGFGYITSFGKVRGFDTSGTPYGETWTDGDIIYFSPTVAGGWTNVTPVAPNLYLPVAVVLNAAPGGSGSIFVRMGASQAINGATGSFTAASGQTITVTNGIITSIV
jgi:hypothetical protein